MIRSKDIRDSEFAILMLRNFRLVCTNPVCSSVHGCINFKISSYRIAHAHAIVGIPEIYHVWKIASGRKECCGLLIPGETSVVGAHNGSGSRTTLTAEHGNPCCISIQCKDARRTATGSIVDWSAEPV